MQQRVSTQMLSRGGTLQNTHLYHLKSCSNSLSQSPMSQEVILVSVLQGYTMPNSSALDPVPIVLAWIPWITAFFSIFLQISVSFTEFYTSLPISKSTGVYVSIPQLRPAHP